MDTNNGHQVPKQVVGAPWGVHPALFRRNLSFSLFLYVSYWKTIAKTSWPFCVPWAQSQRALMTGPHAKQRVTKRARVPDCAKASWDSPHRARTGGRLWSPGCCFLVWWWILHSLLRGLQSTLVRRHVRLPCLDGLRVRDQDPPSATNKPGVSATWGEKGLQHHGDQITPCTD